MQQAVLAIDRLRETVDTLIIVSNDRLLQIIPENTPLQRQPFIVYITIYRLLRQFFVSYFPVSICIRYICTQIQIISRNALYITYAAIASDNALPRRAFSVADDVLRQGVVGISEIIIRPG